MDNEFILQDRIQKIRQIINQYGEDNFYISFSGGKDSTVLSYLIDLAIPGNNIPRVYMNTGIEYNMIRDFVYSLSEKDNRFIIIAPENNIREILEKYGYPFKSKKHAKKVGTYQRNGMTSTAINYIIPKEEYKTFGCPEKLKYQFTPNFKLKVDYKCCVMLKEKPLKNWSKQNNKPYCLLGLKKTECGVRMHAHCLSFQNNKLYSFSPLLPCTDEWENWLIDKYNIDLCNLYYPPYNFERTGCKGCPFSLNLQKQLDVMKNLLPNEYNQCENIWKPVYDEYRRINYRLRNQMTIYDFIDED